MATKISADGVWGSKTESAFCEAIGTWATGTPSHTTNIKTALSRLKVGAVRDLQKYLNMNYGNWRKLTTGAVEPWRIRDMPRLVVDGVMGPKTRIAYVNYVARCAGVEGVVYQGSNNSGVDLFINYDRGTAKGRMRTFQDWINAVNLARMTTASFQPPQFASRRILPTKGSR